jgi:hypothetical protein
MSLTSSWYRELGLELVSLKENCSHLPNQPPMVEEKRDDGEEKQILSIEVHRDEKNGKLWLSQ